MRWLLGAIVVMGSATAGLWVWARASEPRRAGAPVVVEYVLADDEKHRVTPEMEREAEGRAGGEMPGVSVETAGGRVDLASLAGEGPAVVVFIKEGCPCSAAAEPYFRRLHAAYGERARFLGVIGGDRATAREWVETHKTPFEVANDETLAAMKALGVTNSAYVVVAGPGGRIEGVWPGFSKGMLGEVSRLLAGLAGVAEKGIDVADAPEELYTGCPFEFGE
jgi:peroxiredoxin